MAASPAERFIQLADRIHSRRGHENGGFLSWDRGYLPRADPRQELLKSHSAWDEVARCLPELYQNAQVRRRLDELPLLSATARDLPDEYLLRAAALLAILSHAYWYCLPTPVSKLPQALAEPWAEVRHRLGRKDEVITYIDLIVYNWRRKDPSGPLVVSNLSLLFPTIGNQEEQVFYLTQLEILARSTSLVRTLALAQSAVLADDAAQLESELRALCTGLVEIVREGLPKISGQKRHPHYVDAVTWAKSVAPFAVPFEKGIQGPSGTSSPIFNTLDLFFGRKKYSSFLGREIRDLRRTYPPLWRAFLRRVGQVDVGAYVDYVDAPELRDAWASALEAYAGQSGFLGRHRAKVYGFLELAFKVGRAITIGGFGGAFRDRTWEEVDDELESSRAERPLFQPSHSGIVSESRSRRESSDAENRYFFSEVALHNTPEQGFWLVVDGGVYDVTRFRSAHPGGERIIDAYAGTDASSGFGRAHAGLAHANSMLAKFKIGELRQPRLSEEKRIREAPGRGQLALCERDLYRAYTRALNLCVEMQNALRIDLSLAHLVVHPGSAGEAISAYKVARLVETHERFLETELGVLVRETIPHLREMTEVWSGSSAHLRAHETDAARQQNRLIEVLERAIQKAVLRSREVIGLCEEGPLSEATRDLVLSRGESDLRLITSIKEILREAVLAFETDTNSTVLLPTLEKLWSKALAHFLDEFEGEPSESSVVRSPLHSMKTEG
jgi:Indoleamine 2,3-dioxygenase/Cytochrome b5-like Heme/Steroid binding domain